MNNDFNKHEIMDKIDLKIIGVKILLFLVTITYGIMIMNLKSRVSELEEKIKIIYTLKGIDSND